MVKQYGVSEEDQGKAVQARDQIVDRKGKKATSEEVTQFHTNSDVDSRPEAQHHTIGNGPNNAAAGDHDHRTKGKKILDGVVITGSKAGTNAAFNGSVLAALVALGAKDNSS